MITGNRIKITRVNMGVSTEDVCKGILSRSHLSNIEKGRYYPSNDILSSLAKRLNIPEEYLTAFDDLDASVEAELNRMEELLTKDLDVFFIEIDSFKRKHPVILSYEQEIRFHLIQCEGYSRVKNVKGFTEGFERTLLPLTKHTTISNQSLRNRFMKAKGTYHYQQGDYQSAVDSYTRLTRESIDLKEEANILYNLSLTYSKMESWYDSINFMKRAKEHFLNEHLWSDAGDAYLILGSLFRKIDDHERAKYYYEKALNLTKDLSYKILESQALHNLGEIEKRDDNYSKAIEYFTESLSIKEKERFTNQSVTYVSLIDTYIKAKNYDSAKTILENSLRITHEKYYSIQLSVLDEKITFLKGHKSHYENVLLKAISFFEENKSNEMYKLYSMELGYYYFSRKKYKRASEIFKEFFV